MAIPEFVVPVLTAAGPVGLAYVIMRNFSRVTRALLEALVIIVAIFGSDDKHGQRGRDVLDRLIGRDGNRLPVDLTLSMRTSGMKVYAGHPGWSEGV